MMADADRVAGIELDAALLVGEAAGSGHSFLEEWAGHGATQNPVASKLTDGMVIRSRSDPGARL